MKFKNQSLLRLFITSVLLILSTLTPLYGADSPPAPGTTSSSGIWGTVGQFFANNPSNSWDLSVYAIRDETKGALGPGAGISYWLTPSVGAALDVNYITQGGFGDGELSFATLGIAGRGTINIGNFASVSPYAKAGPGWIFSRGSDGKAIDQRIVAITSAGATVDIKAIKFVQFFGEYRHVFAGDSDTVGHNQILVGLTHRF